MISPSGSSLSGEGSRSPLLANRSVWRCPGDIPCLAAQVVDHVAALAGIDQRRHVDIETVLAKLRSLLANPFGIQILQAGTYSVATVLPGALERGDVVEQPVLGFGRQVDQQTLGQPGGRCVGIQSGGP